MSNQDWFTVGIFTGVAIHAIVGLAVGWLQTRWGVRW